MSVHVGFDMAPSALRWHVRDGVTGVGEGGGPVYGVRGCPRHPDYDSATSWSDPLAFRQGAFGEAFASGVEKTVSYEGAEGRASAWLRPFFQGVGGHPPTDVNGTLAAAVPDHATPEERDDVLAGLSAAKYANVSLVWRPVAALLGWMEHQKADLGVDLATLLERRIFVLDLDAGRPELTELACVRHRERPDWIVPCRMRPSAKSVASDATFERACYRAALGGLEAWEQLVGGQFFGSLQRALEAKDPAFAAWIRTKGAWRPQTVTFADALPRDVLQALNPVIADKWRTLDAQDVVLVHGWVMRRYGEQLLRPFKERCRNVLPLAVDAVARGAALFAERLARGLPTFYDRIDDYQFWDGFRMRWTPLFDGEILVEPGQTYRAPAPGAPARQIRVERCADNVSFYVRVPNSTEYARRLKTDFAGFLKEDLRLELSAVVTPEKGSARFSLAMADADAPAVFVAGKARVREIVLRWSNTLNANAAVSVTPVDEHQGYVEPQPVLGRIYDAEDNLRMVEEYVRDSESPVFARLWEAYAARFHPDLKHGIADRVGQDAGSREPTRGLFGTKRVFSARIDKATQDYAAKVAKERPYATPAGNLIANGMLQQNYCHVGALPDYKDMIRRCLRKGVAPRGNFSFYFAAGYVLGEDPGDVKLLLDYLCAQTALDARVRSMLWWSFFRMLCWHPECRLTASDKPALERALAHLCLRDASALTGFAANDAKYLTLAILYALRLRECGEELSEAMQAMLAQVLSRGRLANVPFPATMIPKVDSRSRRPGDTLSAYVLRFLRRQDTLADRELGAAMGGV